MQYALTPPDSNARSKCKKVEVCELGLVFAFTYVSGALWPRSLNEMFVYLFRSSLATAEAATLSEANRRIQ